MKKMSKAALWTLPFLALAGCDQQKSLEGVKNENVTLKEEKATLEKQRDQAKLALETCQIQNKSDQETISHLNNTIEDLKKKEQPPQEEKKS
jgi:hypothetical protein